MNIFVPEAVLKASIRMEVRRKAMEKSQLELPMSMANVWRRYGQCNS